MENTISTEQKALQINLDLAAFGTFAEIGAGQEVVRWFFHVGKASATVAKGISAYDTTVSDELYGSAAHYVSRQRLNAMLNYEYGLLSKRERREQTTFFVFADTAATHSRTPHRGGHAWVGIRFQTRPGSAPSEIVAHVQLLDATTVDQQAALGIVGVNLIYGAFHSHRDPNRLIGGLMDGLRRERVEVDMVKLSGPAFADVDNRLMALQLVEQKLTDAAMFTVDGDVVQPSEVLSGKAVLVERGAFRPVTNVTKAMLEHALEQIYEDPEVNSDNLVVLAEMTLNNLMMQDAIDHQDFLNRADTLGALGKMVMVSNYTRFDHVSNYLRGYTGNRIGLVLGAPALLEIFDERYYVEVEGGILEGLGRLCQGKVKLYVYPMKAGADEAVIDACCLPVAEGANKLYEYLLERGKIEPIRRFDEEQLHIFPNEVLSKIQAGGEDWDALVPAPVAKLIRERKLFGYPGRE